MLVCDGDEALQHGECKAITSALACTSGQVLDSAGNCLELCSSEEAQRRLGSDGEEVSVE